MDKLKGAKYFTKLDVHWGYNNIQIKGDEWKAAFKTNKGLFKPLPNFLDLRTRGYTHSHHRDSLQPLSMTHTLIDDSLTL